MQPMLVPLSIFIWHIQFKLPKYYGAQVLLSKVSEIIFQKLLNNTQTSHDSASQYAVKVNFHTAGNKPEGSSLLFTKKNIHFWFAFSLYLQSLVETFWGK